MTAASSSQPWQPCGSTSGRTRAKVIRRSLSMQLRPLRKSPRPWFHKIKYRLECPLDSNIARRLYTINSQQVIDQNAAHSRYPLQNARRSDSACSLRATVPRRRANGWGSDGSGRGLATGSLKASRHSEGGWPGARPPRRPPSTHYRAQLGALAALIDWTSQMAGLWLSQFDHLEDLLKRMDQ